MSTILPAAPAVLVCGAVGGLALQPPDRRESGAWITDPVLAEQGSSFGVDLVTLQGA